MDDSSSASDRDPLERLAAEFLDRRRRGEEPSPDEYARLHPEMAGQILEFFPALELMEGLKPAADRTASFDGGDAPATPGRLEQLGEYRIVREIGKGGMGVVYEAIQQSLGRRVALKILPLHGRIDPVQIERFRLESRSAARLHHGHIVPVHGMGEHEGVYYYAMQYIQGHGLDVILDDLRRLREGLPAPAGCDGPERDSGSLSVARSLLTGRYTPDRSGLDCASLTVTAAGDTAEDRAEAPEPSSARRSSILSQSTESAYYRTVARLGVQVADALAHAHGQGVLHRDIKPSNLLLDAAGHVWVADFGLAKVEGAEGPTNTGDIVGTLRYMSPERFEGWSDRRSDIYGLGMTLYELLTLRPAFEAATRARLIQQVIHDPPPPPRKLDARVPRDLETVVLKAIAKEPGERYATAEALAADLENYLADRPIVARRSRLPERAWRWCRRNPAAAGLLGAGVVAALALVGVIVGIFDNSRVRASERVALAAEKLAVAARRAEEQERKKAEAATESERGLGYIHQIVLAEREWSGNNMPNAERLLDECDPDRRGWEWHYLKRLCHSEMRTLRGHGDTIYDACFSPDGRAIASASSDDTVGLWDADSGRLIRRFEREDRGSVESVDYSPDGKRLASVSIDYGRPGRLIVRDVVTGQANYRVPIPTGNFVKVVFSPDGRRIAVSTAEGVDAPSKLQIRNAATGAVEKTIDFAPDKVMDPAFSPDGTRLAVAIGSVEIFEMDPKPGEVRVLDVSTARVLYTLVGGARSVGTLAWSPDGRWIAEGGDDRVIKFWDVGTRRIVQRLRGHRAMIHNLAFSHDGRRLASTSEDSTAKIWDTATGDDLLTLRGHRAALHGVAFSPDDRRLVTGSDDHTIKIWDTAAARESLLIRGHRAWATSVDFHRSGERMLSSSIDRTVKVWDPRNGRMLLDIVGHNRPVWCAAFSPDGKLIASAGGDWSKPDESGEVRLWDAATGRKIRSWSAHRRVAWGVAFSPDGKRIVSCGGEIQHGPGDLVLWDLASGRRMRSIVASDDSGICGVAFSPDGLHLASTGVDGTVTLWDAASGKRERILRPHKAFVYGVAFDSEGKWLISASQDNSLAIWDLKNDRIWHTLAGHADWVIGGAFSRDGRRLVSAGHDSVKVWDVSTGRELLTLHGGVAHLWGVAISADSRRIAATDRDGIVRVWDATPADGANSRVD